MALLTPKVANGKPLQTAKNTLMFGDTLRATIFETTPLLFGTAYLYDKALIEGNPNRTWGVGDYLLVAVITWTMRDIGIIRRWT